MVSSFQTRVKQALCDQFGTEAINAHLSRSLSSDESEEALVIDVGDIELWIYENGGGIYGPSIDERIEIYDFKNEDDLVDAAINRFSIYLEKSFL